MLLYASKYHDIDIVVNLSGRYDLKSGIEERLGKDFMERIKKDGFIDITKSGSLSFSLVCACMPQLMKETQQIHVTCFSTLNLNVRLPKGSSGFLYSS